MCVKNSTPTSARPGAVACWLRGWRCCSQGHQVDVYMEVGIQSKNVQRKTNIGPAVGQWSQEFHRRWLWAICLDRNWPGEFGIMQQESPPTWRQDQKPHTSKQLRVAHILAAENTANAFIVRNHTENKTHQKNIIIRARNWGKYDDKKQFQQLAGPANYCFL